MFSLERGLQKFEELITDDEYLLVQQPIEELKKLLRQERLYGESPATSQQIWIQVGTLICFMHEHYTPQTFNDLCQ